MPMTACVPVSPDREAGPQATPAAPLLDLANWWSRSDQPIESGRLNRRAARIARLKRILPLVGIIAVVAALMWPLLKPDLPASTYKPPSGSDAPGQSTMLDMTYRGINDKGEPYTIVSEKAVRNLPLGADPKKAAVPPVINLATPLATLQNSDGSTAKLKATTGVYNETDQGLNLDGAVQVDRSDGMQLTTPQLSVDFQKQRAWSDQPSAATGSFGKIEGQGLRLENGGKTVIFTGQTRATLNGAANPEPSASK